MALSKSSSTRGNESYIQQNLRDENILMAQLKLFTQMDDKKPATPLAVWGSKTQKDMSSWTPKFERTQNIFIWMGGGNEIFCNLLSNSN